jgi:CRISPR/Cas system-associated endonuclease Cas3-HD
MSEDLQKMRDMREAISKILDEYPEKLDLTNTEQMLIKRLRSALNANQPSKEVENR